MGFMRQTFDVDARRLPNGYLIIPGPRDLEKVMRRIGRCIYVHEILWRESASGNGYHVAVECDGDGMECEACRLCFDDSYRFMLDQVYRKPHQRNVLWKRKTYHKGGSVLTLEAGEWQSVR